MTPLNRIQSVKITQTTGSFSKGEAEKKAKDKFLNQRIAKQKDELAGILKKLELNNLAIVSDKRLVSIIHDILGIDDIDTLIGLLTIIVR